MKHFFLNIRYLLEYAAAAVPYFLIRLMPHALIHPIARFFAFFLRLLPSQKSVVEANIRAAMPELSSEEVRRIGRESTCHLLRNLFEFFWLHGNPERIRRCYYLPPDVTEKLKEAIADGGRIIFVNPHLGSWEASGIMAPFYAGVRMAAIAKPMKNSYLNRMLNVGNREKIPGLEIIFSKGAVRAAISALKSGKSLGTLIDQNTRVRDGGVFVNFFGIPVPSSTAPANLLHYCHAHEIPAVIIYGTSLRQADGRVVAHMEYLKKKLEDYQSDTEILQELMGITEQYIRRYPEQYLWFYKRFCYIPPEASDEVRKRYPAYARTAPPSFFRKVLKRS